jgi:hypothetical protein
MRGNSPWSQKTANSSPYWSKIAVVPTPGRMLILPITPISLFCIRISLSNFQNSLKIHSIWIVVSPLLGCCVILFLYLAIPHYYDFECLFILSCFEFFVCLVNAEEVSIGQFTIFCGCIGSNDHVWMVSSIKYCQRSQ